MDITHKQRETLGFQTQKNVISNTLYAVLYTRVINKMYRFFSTYIYLSIDRLFYCVCTCAVYTNVALVINKEKCAYDLWSLKVIVAVLVFSQPILEFLFQFPISYMLVYPKHKFFCGWIDSDSDISILCIINYISSILQQYAQIDVHMHLGVYEIISWI